MDKKNTGGPAFPTPIDAVGNYSDYHYAKDGVNGPGMTLRDYFAAQAMQGWLSTFTDPDVAFPVGDNAERLARCAYMMADSMLKAREQ